jgi:hypothetical protein
LKLLKAAAGWPRHAGDQRDECRHRARATLDEVARHQAAHAVGAHDRAEERVRLLQRRDAVIVQVRDLADPHRKRPALHLRQTLKCVGHRAIQAASRRERQADLGDALPPLIRPI